MKEPMDPKRESFITATAIRITDMAMEVISATVRLTVETYALKHPAFNRKAFSVADAGDRMNEWVKTELQGENARIVASEIAQKAEEVALAQCMRIESMEA